MKYFLKFENQPNKYEKTNPAFGLIDLRYIWSIS
jgi:hypothetical protein